jgi:hypothetical protein
MQCIPIRPVGRQAARRSVGQNFHECAVREPSGYDSTLVAHLYSPLLPMNCSTISRRCRRSRCSAR